MMIGWRVKPERERERKRVDRSPRLFDDSNFVHTGIHHPFVEPLSSWLIGTRSLWGDFSSAVVGVD